MRHALITIRLMDQARDGAIAQADADERLEHQAQAKLPAKPGRVVTWPAASAPWWHAQP